MFIEDNADQPGQKRMTRAQSSRPKADIASDLLPNEDPPSCKIPLKPTKRGSKKKKQFPFLLLPTEVRVMIYHLSLTYDHILIRKAKARRGAASLLLTNRVIYSEAFPIFYDVNVFQVHIGGLPGDNETALANVHFMRQCCLHLELVRKAKSSVLTRLTDKFVAEIWSGKMECLLVDVWEPDEWRCGTAFLEKLRWVKHLHLAQVHVNQVNKKGEVHHYNDPWCQRLERCMMASGEVYHDHEKYCITPRLGIDLVGEELEKAKRMGGWVVQDNDLYALFGKTS
ncbi:MAG: hypothetical protein LQ344_003514 [Seirophora lacunosa]|nr:MAG: hypothetical protein LQ344_003514 [Seirophora lacunosa]